MSLYAELRRRNVFRAGLAIGFSAVKQFADFFNIRWPWRIVPDLLA